MKDFLYALRSGFGFLTTIPVGITMEGIEMLMKRIYLFPVVGSVIGLIVGLAVYFIMLLPANAVSIISIAAIILLYYLTGFNHLDGLADFGDGVAAHGTRDDKIKAMKDVALGVGGITFVVLALILLMTLFTSILQSSINGTLLMSIPAIFVVGEIGAKHAMVTLAFTGRPIHKGFGAITVENARSKDFIISTIFSLAVSFAILHVVGLLSIMASMLSSLFVLNIANRHFGGVSGDAIGAANEIGRIAVFITIFLGGLLGLWGLWIR